MTAAAKKTPVVKALPLSAADRTHVNAVLNAAGIALVTRAMTKVCRPKYNNKGWNNCFFVQMFGGKANIDRMVEAYSRRTGVVFNKNPLDDYDYDNYVAVIADKLGVDRGDVVQVIELFDDGSKLYREEEYVELGNVGDRFTKHADELGYAKHDFIVEGKVVNLLNHIYSWLARRGVAFDFTVEAHKVGKAQ